MREQTPLKARIGLVDNLTEWIYLASDVDRELSALSARCTALEQEREHLKADSEWRDRWHTRLGRLHQPEGRFYESIEGKLARCQHLEQAVKELPAKIMNIRADRVGLQPSPFRGAFREGHRDARHAAAELATEALSALLSSQDETNE